jgi:hypothetical protein
MTTAIINRAERLADTLTDKIVIRKNTPTRQPFCGGNCVWQYPGTCSPGCRCNSAYNWCEQA